MSSPYHYPEGPYSNLPFNPHKKYFAVGYWAFMATGFFAPFGIAGTSARRASNCLLRRGANEVGHSLPDIQGAVRAWFKEGLSVFSPGGDGDTVLGDHSGSTCKFENLANTLVNRVHSLIPMQLDNLYRLADSLCSM